MRTFVAFGANLGDPPKTYDRVASVIAAMPGIESLRRSPLYRTTPVGGPTDQPDYCNAAFEIETTLEPADLHQKMQQLQRDFGRDASKPEAPRTLDLDILLFDNQIIESDDLLIPHPRMHYRWFVLKPLVDLDPTVLHPILSDTVSGLFGRVEHPAPNLLLVASSSEILHLAQQTIAARSPAASTSHCPISDQDVNFLRVGGNLVAIAKDHNRTWSKEANAPDWAIVLQANDSNPRPAGAKRVLPAVDCRAPTWERQSEKLKRFLDARQPGLRVSQRTTPSVERDRQNTSLDFGQATGP